MVDAEAITKEVSQLLVTGLGYLEGEPMNEGEGRRGKIGKRGK